MLGTILLIGAAPDLPASHELCGWAQYAAHPSKRACRCLTEQLEARKASGYADEARPTSLEAMKLIALLEKGDSCSAGLALASFHVLDGGDLEDMMRAVSALSASHPSLLLQVLDAQKMPAAGIESLMRMLPLSTVDDPGRKRSMVKQRIAALLGVHDSKLRRVRGIAVESLDHYLRELH